MKVNVRINFENAKRLARNHGSWRVYIINCSYHRPTRKGGDK